MPLPAPGRRIVELAGLALRERDQFANRLRLDRGVHQHDQRARGDQSDRCEVLARVVADIRVERRIDRERAGAAEAERVAVGRALRDLARRDRAAGAALVLDHDLLAERAAHLLGDDARHHVVAAAGRIGNDQRDRPRRIVLRRCGARKNARTPSRARAARLVMRCPPSRRSREHSALPKNETAGLILRAGGSWKMYATPLRGRAATSSIAARCRR